MPFIDDAADAGVEVAGVLAHDDVVDVLGPLVLERRLDAREEPDRAQVDVLVEREARLQQDALLEDAGLHVGVADGAEQDRVVLAQLLDGTLSGRVSPVRLVALAAEVEVRQVELEAELRAAAASRTFTASRVTSGPVPSPGITAMLYVFMDEISFLVGDQWPAGRRRPTMRPKGYPEAP